MYFQIYKRDNVWIWKQRKKRMWINFKRIYKWITKCCRFCKFIHILIKILIFIALNFRMKWGLWIYWLLKLMRITKILSKNFIATKRILKFTNSMNYIHGVIQIIIILAIHNLIMKKRDLQKSTSIIIMIEILKTLSLIKVI